MPKELTHWLIADKVCAGLSSSCHLRSVIEAHRPAYLGGAVLPDTLLHLFRGPHAATARALGHAFHDTPDNSFAPLIHAEARFPDGLPPALLACLLGVITHIQGDICFHPFIFALTGAAGIGQHYRIETDIDCHFLHNGTISAKMRLTDLISVNSRETLVKAAALLFDPAGRLPSAALEQAVASHCRLQAMYDSTFWTLAVRLLAMTMGSPYREQRHLFYPLSRRTIISPFADSARGWQHPVNGEQQHSTLEDLVESAAQRCIALFKLIEEHGRLTPALDSQAGENLLTGLHAVKRSAMNSRSSG